MICMRKALRNVLGGLLDVLVIFKMCIQGVFVRRFFRIKFFIYAFGTFCCVVFFVMRNKCWTVLHGPNTAFCCIHLNFQQHASTGSHDLLLSTMKLFFAELSSNE